MRGLLLNEQYGMWDAVLQKIKTNTRRVGQMDTVINKDPDNYEYKGFYQSEASKSLYAEFQHKVTGKIEHVIVRYKQGDRAYLQEPINRAGEQILYHYRDANGVRESEVFKPLVEKAKASGALWENKYFMKQEHARFFVIFKTNPKVERLHDISDTDCFAEGIRIHSPAPNDFPDISSGYYYTKDGVKKILSTVQKAYFSLYNEINKGNKGHANPWVFSYYFELCPKHY